MYYIYVWKDGTGTPFYVGMTKFMHRADPMRKTNRGNACKHKLAEIGPENVTVEVHQARTTENAKMLEKTLIKKYGRAHLRDGTLTNILPGGEAKRPLPPESEIDMSAYMKTLWTKPEYRNARVAERTGKPIHTEAHKAELREQLLDPSNPLREYHKVLNADPAIIAKRNATLRAPEARAAMADKSKTAWNQRSPEARARQTARSKEPHSAESRAKMSAALKKAWARRKAAE